MSKAKEETADETPTEPTKRTNPPNVYDAKVIVTPGKAGLLVQRMVVDSEHRILLKSLADGAGFTIGVKGAGALRELLNQWIADTALGSSAWHTTEDPFALAK